MRTNVAFDRQSFGDCCSRNIARLLASSAHFSPEENGFEMRLAYAFGNDETARIVREIGELAYENTKVWQKSQWIQRSWLTEQMSLVRIYINFYCDANGAHAVCLYFLA